MVIDVTEATATSDEEEGLTAEERRRLVSGGRVLTLSRLTLILLLVVVVVALALAMMIGRPGADIERSDWAYDQTQLDMAYDQGLRGQGVRVGIVDTGIDVGHPCLDGVDLVAWKDLVDGRGEPYDDSGHGTAMASIIAGQGDLRGGVPEVELIVAKVIAEDGSSSDRLIADGIDFCLDPDGDGDYSDGADVISLSLGGNWGRIQVMVGLSTNAAVSEAVANGVVVVAAAGNAGGVGDVALPGRLPDVVCVGAVDSNGLLAPFSQGGNDTLQNPDPNRKPEVVAPGVDINTAFVDGGYAKGSGTSHATAFVTAALAAALSGEPELAHNGEHGGDRQAVVSIKTALMVSAQPLEGQEVPHDLRAGYGLVSAVFLYEVLADEGWDGHGT